MKIRLSNNSIRIRISAEELSNLSKGEVVYMTIRFSILEHLSCELKPWNLEISQVTFESGKLSINIPSSFATKWTENPMAVLEFHHENESDHPLQIRIEKDLQKA